MMMMMMIVLGTVDEEAVRWNGMTSGSIIRLYVGYTTSFSLGPFRLCEHVCLAT
jgi:hypothetical protein